MQVPMGAHSSSLKNWGWALTRRRCLNSPTMPVQAPTPDLDRHYWIDSHCRGKRGQCSSRESCSLLENGPTWSFVAIALQRLLLAICKFRTASKERCVRGYDRCVQTLLPDVVAPETHRNSLRELKLRIFESPRKNFSWWAVTRRTSQTTELSKLGGGPLFKDGHLHGTIRYLQNCYVAVLW